MNTSPALETPAVNSAQVGISRREALRRAALFLGAALAPSVLSGALQAATAVPAPGAKPAYLSPAQFELAGALAERILPRTDTPGAIDVGVPAFIDLMYGKYLSAEEQKTFAAGLIDLDKTAATAHGQGFSKLTSTQQDAVLMQAALAAQKQEKTFLHQIRELTVVGYFTSEIVGRTVLHYDPVPGRFDGCVPISEVGNRLWTK